jgi:AcrR family transcriptional regulator
VTFAYNGLAAANIAGIAQEAGISTGLLYHYFPSKEILFEELVNNAVHFSGASMMNYQNTTGTAKEKLQLISRSITDILQRGTKTAQYFTLMLQAGLVRDGSMSKHLVNSTLPFKILSGIIEEGQRERTFKPGDPMQLAILYWASLQGICAFKLTMREFFQCPDPSLLDGVLLKEEPGSIHNG